MIGRTIGPYEVVAKLGEGGMGQVYRARDLQLHRDVAIKILPPHLRDDVESMARFEREARMLAALNHPHVAMIYGVETLAPDSGVQAAPVRAIVLELVEGETLAERVSRGPLPVPEALAIAAGIADAVAAAHAKGIVHRDLKPANVKVTPDGAVKVLDFGLAKATGAIGADEETRAPLGVTAGPEPTRHGTILGTTAYMSPEQARGRVVDQRADVWSFGCVLFELLTGAAAFRRETVPDTLAAILDREPAWDRLPAATPAAIRRLLQQCLDKDPALRLADLGEARTTLTLAAAPRSRSARWGWVAAGVMTVAAVAAIAYGRGLLDTFGARPDRPLIRSVAVLPLAEIGANAGDDYFANGMTDELIAALSRIGAWRVISRTSVMGYRGTTKALPAIARELNVDALVEGSVQRANGRVRISVRLVRAGPEEVSLWDQSYDRDLRDVLDVQAEVARAITSRIQLTLTPTEAERLAVRRPVDPEVLDLYLKGRAAAELGTEEKINEGIRAFEAALAKDRAFAPAYAALAIAYNNLNPSYRAPKDVMPKARQYATRAIEIDPTLSEAHTALASVLFRYDWDWAGTEREIRLAIDLNPSSADARDLYGNYLCAIGRQAEAIAELTTARDLSPSALTIQASLLGVYVTGQQYDDAIREARRVIERHPTFAFAHAWLGMAYVLKKQFALALPALTLAESLDKNVTTTHFLAIAHAAAGNRGEAERLVKDLESAASARYACAYEISGVYVLLGKPDKAMQWLDRGVDEQCDCMVWLKTEPWMDPLRVDARYVDLIKRLRFPQ